MNYPVEELADDVGTDDAVPTEATRLKILKSFDPPPPPPELPPHSSGGEHLLSPRSPETFLELLAGSIDPAEQLNDSTLAVEELTVRNYMIPSSSAGASSTVRVEPRGLWPNLTRLGGALPNSLGNRPPLTMETRDDAWGLFLPQIGARRPPLPIRRSTPPPSGFPQFAIKKGKEVASASRIQSSRTKKNQSTEIASNLPHRRGGKPVFGGGGENASVPVPHHEGTSMREWLKQRQHKFNKDERLNFFRQILELVEITHSQGLSLHSLRPSYFMIFTTNQIKYIGSLVPEGQPRPLTRPADEDGRSSVRSGSKRKVNLQPEAVGNLSPKHRKVWQPDYGTLTAQISDNGYRRQHLELGELCYPDHKFQIPAIQLLKSDIRKMEERWYASPEEQNDNICYLSSNIYNLGVLVFELFCHFDTLEAHYAAMSDLQHRILPPNFLSENPKEASLCLWLLHPDPSSRPKSRDILTCGLVCEGRNRLSLNQSSTSINEEDAEVDLLLHFLFTSKDQKEKDAAKLVADLGSVQADIVEAEKRHSSRVKTLSSARDLLTNSIENPDISLYRGLIHENNVSPVSISSTQNDRLMSNIDQLKNAYFSMRSEIELSESNVPVRSDIDVLKIRDRNIQVRTDTNSLKESTDRLGTFFDGLCKYARYSRFEVCSTLRNVDILNSSNVICSLSFDRDEDYFAAAGVSKKIKIFEYSSLLNDNVDIHYPLIEMSNRSMLSCVCWNNYIKNYLASTDYEGVVQLWDASTGQGFTKYKEHQKRAWSVDFSQTDPMKLASGSDDCSVKLWSINENSCVGTIRSMANICCVKFSSYSHFLAFGSSDYKIYCYDLRNTRIPWCTLSGHGKAVSYVKFIDPETLVSASTDNTLKLWDLNKTNPGGLSTDACSLTFSGHTNEKNFVGLSVSDGYIACGSETNEVYAYYKTLPMPFTTHKFGSADPITGKEMGNDNRQSVSSVCWRTKSNTLIAGTSNGSMKLLKLV